MHPMIENFMERPTSHKVGAWAGVLIVLLGIFWQYIYGPVSTELSAEEDKRVQLNSQITNEKRLERERPKFQEEVKSLEVKLKIALEELPDEKEIPELLKSVSDLAKDAGLEVSLFRPEPEVQRDFFAEVPVNMLVEGTYHQVATFFDEVGRMSRIVNLKGIDISDPRASDRGLIVKANCTAVTFRYIDEEERAKAAKAGEDAKGKKRRK